MKSKLEEKSIYVGQKAGKSTQELDAAGYVHSGEQRENECM